VDAVIGLSLRQPWAHAVLHLGKDIENRRWNTKYRGEFLIHAAKGMTRNEYVDALRFCGAALERELTVDEFPSAAALPRGGFVGVARIVSVLPPCVRECPNHRWHMPEQYGFRLTDVRASAFVPYSARLGFFKVPEDVAARVMGSVAA
jgi:hypothetical protein